MERFHHTFNVGRQATRLLQDRTLISAEGDQLECNWQTLFKTILRSK